MSSAELAHPRPGGVPPAVLWIIRCLNLVFNFLNALWLSKMLKGAIKVCLCACSACKQCTACGQACGHMIGIANLSHLCLRIWS